MPNPTAKRSRSRSQVAALPLLFSRVEFRRASRILEARRSPNLNLHLARNSLPNRNPSLNLAPLPSRLVRGVPPKVWSSKAARSARIASRIFSIASSLVSSSDQQPGSPGTETRIPSSLRWSTTLYRMAAPASMIMEPITCDDPHLGDLLVGRIVLAGLSHRKNSSRVLQQLGWGVSPFPSEAKQTERV